MKRQRHGLWKYVRLLLLVGLFASPQMESNAQTALSAGDVVCTGFNSNVDGSNQKFFQYVLLKDIAAGTTFKMSGNTFQTSSAVGSGSATCLVRAGVVKWVASSAMTKGTVINITTNTGGSVSASVGTASILSGCSCTSGGVYNNNSSGGKVLIYYSPSGDGTGSGQDFTGTSGTVTFKGTLVSLTAWQGTTSNTDFPTSGADVNVPYRPSDVTDTTFIASNARGGYYSGSRSFTSAASARAAIYNRANWTVNSSTSSTGAFTGGNFSFGTTPTFTGAGTITACSSGAAVSINSNLAITDGTSAGTVDTFSVFASPVHGSLSGFSTTTTTASDGTATPSGLSYSPTSGYTGTDSFKIKATNTTGNSATKTIIVTVSASPNAGTISITTGSGGAISDSFCATAYVDYVTSGSGGTWSSTNTAIATVDNTTVPGRVTGIYSSSTMPLGGTTTISYTVTTASCGSQSATRSVYIRPFSDTGSSRYPASGTIICTGATVTATSNSVTNGLPRYNNTTYGHTWTTSNSSIATVNPSTGDITGRAAGTVNITYTTAPNGCGSFFSKRSITIQTTPTGGTMSGAASICTGASTTYSVTGATTGGTWSSSNTSVATVDPSSGSVTGVGAGTATISYTATSASCGSASSTQSITINAASGAGTISGSSSVCVSGNTTLTTSGSTGGTWSSSNASLATVNTSSGVVYGVSTGSVTITYSYTGACGTSVATYPMTVNGLPVAGTISGSSNVCESATTTLTTTGTGGSWSSSSTSNATVSSSGVVRGVAAGSATISYSVTDGCGTSVATQSMTINPLPNAGSISGSSSLCETSGTTLSTSGSTGGTWSTSSTSIATNSGSNIYAVSAGSVTVSYAVTNGCGTDVATHSMTVNPLPNAGTISGSTTVCTGGSTVLSTGGMTGGTWSTSSTSIATNSGATIYGASAGSVTISYAKTNSCGTDVATYSMTVNTTPDAGSISGTTNTCVASSSALTSSGMTGGTWTSGNTSLATVDASGNVYGVSAGVVAISYSVTTVCGTDVASVNFSVNALPDAGTVSGSTSVCVGANTPLFSTAPSGTWSTSDASVATISTTGTLHGVAVGTATISYSKSNGCGTDIATYSITVNPLPDAGSISGTASACVGASSTLSTSGSTGGTWSTSSSSVATNSGSDIYGVSAGSVTVSYAVTNGCGTDIATQSFTVNPMPNAGTISGSTSVCTGAHTVLTTSGTGGSWSTSSSSIATNSGATVYGASAGSTTISYSVSNSCGTDVATYSMTVNPTADAGSISGTTNTCVASSSALTASGMSGGSWTSGNTSLATVDASGNVYGVSAGVVAISYSVTTACGTDVASVNFSVNPLPDAGTISGSTSVCVGANTPLFSTAPSGTWNTSDASVATISATGTLHGVATGTATISYSKSNGCGTDVATYSITVNPLPSSGSISGVTTTCVGTSRTLTASGMSGGSWSTSNTSIATASSAGTVYGVSAGTVNVTYSYTNTCGTSNATTSFTVSPLADAGTISGTSSICAGANTTLTSTGVSGGTWSSSTPTVATVSTTGLVHSLTAGSTTITYTVSNGCGSVYTTYGVTVGGTIAVFTVTGTSPICAGANTTLTTTGPAGGTWTSSIPSVATVNSGGTVYGVSGGATWIAYSVTNVCGTRSVQMALTVTPLASAGTISGATTVCTGASATLTGTTTGGTWVSTNTSVATVNSSGVVRGVAVGSTQIMHIQTTACSSDTARYNMTVNPTPVAGTVTSLTNLCVGSTGTYTSTGTGGTWSSTNSSVATINPSTGVATAVSVGTANMVYTVSNSCGTSNTTSAVLNVRALPNAGVISGSSSTCVGTTATLSTTGSGGTWSSSASTIASISGASPVYGGVSAGSAIISYSVSTAYCGSQTATYSVSVNPAPNAGVISGLLSVCAGSTTAYTTTGISGGTWSVSDASIATISPSSGVVTGVAAGRFSVTYTQTNSCGTASSVGSGTTMALPTAPVITNTVTSLSVGTTLTMTSPGGGVWSSSDTSIATVDSISGVVTGVTLGSVNITKTASTACGSASSYKTVRVKGLYFTGGSELSLRACANSGANAFWLSLRAYNSVSGRTLRWSVLSAPVSGTISPSTVTATSIVGINTPPTIYYNTASSFIGLDSFIIGVNDGYAYDTMKIYMNVVANPAAPTVSGPSSICVGSSITLTGSPSGGTWSSNSSAAITYTSAGLVNGVAVSGAPIMYYKVVNSDGCSNKTAYPVTVVGTSIGAISSSSSTFCPGATLTLTAGTPSGTWVVTNPTLATVTATSSNTASLTLSSAGLGGRDTVVYTASNACGTFSINYPVNLVANLPAAINGPSATLCPGVTYTFSDPTSGGTWTSSNTSVATVNSSTGSLTAVVGTGGTATLSYTKVNACGYTGTVTKAVAVYAPLSAGIISGATSVIVGNTITLATTGTGGVWSSSNTSLATVNTVGAVRGVAAGVDTIKYTVTRSACSTSAVAVYPVTVTTSRGELSVATDNANMELYPNPASSIVNIKVAGSNELESVIVTDIEGKVVYSGKSETNETTVDMGAFANGMYLFRVVAAGEVYIQKVMVSK